jgi:hypothetical protein
MTGHRPFRELTKRLTGARKTRVADKAAALETALALHELRNLRRYVEALGGTLEITAHFPDGAVTIAEVGEAEAGE